MVPNHQLNELIVDFEIINSESLVFSTSVNDIYIQKYMNTNSTPEIIYTHSTSKSLIQDHYISKLHYFRECDKFFAISQIRPDIHHQNLMEQQPSDQGSSSFQI